MKVKDLKKILESVPDNLEVVMAGGRDHSYLTTISAKTLIAEKNDDDYCQYYHTDGMRDPLQSTLINVLAIY